jgi:hypothetical protein
MLYMRIFWQERMQPGKKSEVLKTALVDKIVDNLQVLQHGIEHHIAYHPDTSASLFLDQGSAFVTLFLSLPSTSTAPPPTPFACR